MSDIIHWLLQIFDINYIFKIQKLNGTPKICKSIGRKKLNMRMRMKTMMKTMMTTTKVHVEELHVQQQLFCSNKNMYTFSNFHWCCLLGHDEGRASSFTYCGHVLRTLQEKGFVLHEMFQEDVSKFTIFSVTQENQHRFSHSHKL